MATMAPTIQKVSSDIQQQIRLGVRRPTNMLFYGATIGSILLSLFTVRRNPGMATFFGLWAPTILGFGILFKENRLLDLELRREGEQTSE